MSGICDTFGGSIMGDVLTFNPDAIPEPDTLHISMTRGERRIADELRKAFGGFEHVIIDVDGERHEFDAESFIRLLESYEGASGTRWHELFGTPEQAIAATLGRGECEMEWVSDWIGWHCKACDSLRQGLPDQKPNYCPNCGRKVVKR